jgi:hypothetical protein
MAPGERSEDDEMDLINAEFESMVSGLNLDQSSPRTYLDDLDAVQRDEIGEVDRSYQAPIKGENSLSGIIQAITRWWHRKENKEGDGAEL